MTGFARSADGTQIAYRLLGSGPPAVIVHGGLGTAASWLPVAERLAERFDVLVYDRRGRGESDHGRAAHALEREVEDAEAVMAVAGPGAALVGHSFGGAVALEAARRAAAGRLAAVVVYEPAVGVGGTIAPAEIERMEALVAGGDREAALDLAAAALDAAGLVTADRRAPGARRADAVLALAATVPRELRAVTAPGLEPARYREVAVPALVLAGTGSPAAQRRFCAALAAALPDGRLDWLDGLGHIAHMAAPDTVAAVLAGFLTAAQPSQRESSPSASGRT